MNCATHPNVPASAYCRTCGKAVCESCKRDVKGVIYCQDCLAARLEGTVPAGAQVPGVAVAPPVHDGTPNAALAMILGFIPGVGAFYNGQFAKGFIHVAVLAVLIKLADTADIFGLAVAAWFFYMVFDAYKTARARQLGLPLPDPLGLNNLFGQESTPAPRPSVPPAAASDPNVPLQSFAPQTYVPASEYAARDDRYSRRGPTGAIVLICLGLLFLLNNWGIFHWYWTGRYWPIILIVLGLWIAAKRMSEARGPQEQREQSNG